MNISESVKWSVLERSEHGGFVQNCRVPKDTFFYSSWSTRDGGRLPAPILSVPEEGANVVIAQKPDIRHLEGRRIEDWYRVQEIKTPKVISGPYGDMGLWVCIEREKGKKGGHWRGSLISI